MENKVRRVRVNFKFWSLRFVKISWKHRCRYLTIELSDVRFVPKVFLKRGHIDSVT